LEPLNKFCFDCHQSKPTWASINNGVLICEICAEKHKNLDINISFVKYLFNDIWDDNLAMYIQISGNKRYISLMKEYDFPLDLPIDQKYTTVLADYYRKLLYSEVNGQEIPNKPDKDIALKNLIKYEEEVTKIKKRTPKKRIFKQN